jgi:hypothetical protein
MKLLQNKYFKYALISLVVIGLGFIIYNTFINDNQQNQQQEKQEEPLKYQDKIDATINSVINALKTTTLRGPASEVLFKPLEDLERLIENDPELSDEARALNLKYLSSSIESKIRGAQSK